MDRTMLVVALLAVPALAAEVDVASLYEVSTEGSSRTVKAGEAGKVVIAIKTRGGAHVSDEAPLKIELSSKQSRLDRDRLTYADSVARKAEGATAPPDPRFEVGFTPRSPGPASVDARLTFFICTEQLCARQSKQVSVAVAVE